MKYLTIISVLVFFIAGSIDAQEFKNYDLYLKNTYLYNPASNVNNQLLNVYSNSHIQWTGLNGAPKTYSFGVSSSFFENMGAGVSIISSKQGLVNNLDAKIHYAYQIKFSDYHFLKIGASLGVVNDRLSVSEAQYVDVTDQKLNENYFNKTVFSTGFGLAYQYKDFDAQIILPQLHEYGTSNLYTIGILGYNFNLNSNIDLKPSIMMRGVKTSPFQFDGNIMATWNKQIWTQFTYRSNNSFIIGIGVDIDNYSIGYAYQINTGEISAVANGTHEIQVMFNINRNPAAKPIKTILFGTVNSKINGTPIDAKITIYEDDVELISINSNEPIGSYNTTLSDNKTYKIEVTANGYKPVVEFLDIDEKATEKELNFILIDEKTNISGNVINKYTNEPIKADIKVFEDNKEILSISTDNFGKYSMQLESGKKYSVEISSDNYFNNQTELIVNKDEEMLTQDLLLSPIVKLIGVVTDFKTGKPMGVSIEIYNLENNELVDVIQSNPVTGAYYKVLPDIDEISITAITADYLFFSENISIDKKSKINKKNIQLQPVELGATVVLNNVNFDLGKTDLRPEAYPEIDRLIIIMMQFKTIVVEISGHTDNTGTDTINKELSQERAQSVIDYMVSKGISKNRLVPVGYGPDKPRSTNNTDEGRQLNRRVEAEIIKE